MDTKLVSIPCRTHIRCWMLKEFGAEPLTAKLNNLLGGIIRNAATGAYIHCREIKSPGTDSIQICLSPKLMRFLGSDNVKKEIGYLLEEQFRLALITYVRAQHALGVSVMAACQSFYTTYNLVESDYDLDALRKIWRDHVNRVHKLAA